MSKMAAVNRWQLWREVTTDDTGLIGLVEPSQLAAPRAEQDIAIECKHCKEIELMFFVVGGAGTDVFQFAIKGWMEEGAGNVLYTMGTGAAGVTASNIITAEQPHPDIASGNYRYMDAIASPTNLCGATFTALADTGSTLFIPTKGYKYLTLQVYDVGAGGTDPDSVHAVWRPTERFED